MERTAIQELIIEWQQKKKTLPVIYLPIIESFINDLRSKQLKEKEQIIWSFEYKTGWESFHEEDGEKFFKETFEK